MRTAGIVALLSISPILMAESLAGLWQGTVPRLAAYTFPFKFELQGDGSNIKGSFFNGEERFTSTSGQLANDALTLEWSYFASKLEATVANGTLEGKYSRARSSPVVFHARRFTAPAGGKRQGSFDRRAVGAGEREKLVRASRRGT